MDSLTDEAINISKRFACGESLTPNEVIFLQKYMEEIRRIDKPTLMDQLSKAFDYIKNIWANVGVDSTDDYVINTNPEVN